MQKNSDSVVEIATNESDLHIHQSEVPEWRSTIAVEWLQNCVARRQQAMERALYACREAKRIALREPGYADSRLAGHMLVEVDHQFAIALVGAALIGESLEFETRQVEASLLTIGGSGSSRARDESADYATSAAWMAAVRRSEQISAGLFTTHLIKQAVIDFQQGRLSPLAYALNTNLERGNATISSMIFLRSTAKSPVASLRG